MARRSRFSLEVRERAVRMVFEHGGEYGSQWEVIRSIAAGRMCRLAGLSGSVTTSTARPFPDLSRERPARGLIPAHGSRLFIFPEGPTDRRASRNTRDGLGVRLGRALGSHGGD